LRAARCTSLARFAFPAVLIFLQLMSTTQSPPKKEMKFLSIAALERGMSRFALRVHVDYVHRLLSFTSAQGPGRLFRADVSDESGLIGACLIVAFCAFSSF
jgi:hypothetical protein